MKAVSKWDKRRKRLFHIIEVGSDFDEHSRWYDYENAAAILRYLAAGTIKGIGPATAAKIVEKLPAEC